MLTLEEKLDDAETWVCCDWPRRAIVAEHKASEYARMLDMVLAGLDSWDEVCPACNGVGEHKADCISFEIARLIKEG